MACFVKAEIWINKSCAAIFTDQLASTMNQYSNIVIDEHKFFSVQQGVQYQFAKFEFIDHMHTNK